MASSDEYQQIQFWNADITCLQIMRKGDRITLIYKATLDFGNKPRPTLFCEELKKNNK